MEKLKKLATLFLATSAVFSLVACGRKDDVAEDDHTLTVSVNRQYQSYIEAIKPKFEKKHHVKVIVNIEPQAEALDDLKLQGPAGKAPDILLAPFDRLGNLKRQGQLAKVHVRSTRYTKSDKRLVTLDGKQYGIPATINTLVLYYNKDLVRHAPKNFKALEELAKDQKYQYSQNKKANIAFLTQWTNFYKAYGMIKGYGGYIFGDKNTDPTKIGLANKGAVQGLTYMSDWYKKVWPKEMQNPDTNEDFITDQFCQGKVAAVIDLPSKAKTYQKSHINYGVAPLPDLNNGHAYTSFADGQAWVMSRYAHNKALSQKFLDYLTTARNQRKLYEITKEVPANENAREEVASLSVVRHDELTNAIIAQYQNAIPLPLIPQMTEVWPITQTMMDNVASGRKSPKAAASHATKRLQTELEQKYHDPH